MYPRWSSKDRLWFIHSSTPYAQGVKGAEREELPFIITRGLKEITRFLDFRVVLLLVGSQLEILY